MSHTDLCLARENQLLLTCQNLTQRCILMKNKTCNLSTLGLAISVLLCNACTPEEEEGNNQQEPSTMCEGSECMQPEPMENPDPDVCEGDEDTCLDRVEGVVLSFLDVKYDLSKPVYVNNRIPIEYGLTAQQASGEPRQVAVSFSFIEAEPADPEAPIECSSSALVQELAMDGSEQRFSGVIWPTTVCSALIGKPVNLRVAFDGGEEVSQGAGSASMTLSAANKDEARNALCVTPGGDKGCVYDITIEPTPTQGSDTLIDVAHAAMNASSSVALLPEKDSTPLLSMASVLVINGRDPYVSAIEPSRIPEDLLEDDPELAEDLQFGLTPEQAQELIAMPGDASLRYEIRPLDSEEDYLPLRVSIPGDASNERADVAPITELQPGSPNTFAHELFAQAQTREALAEGGAWSAITDFEVRGCFDASFDQAGNEGAGSPEADCRSVDVILMRDAGGSSSASLFELNERLERNLGGSRLKLEMGLETENRLDTQGISSRVEGNVSIKGKLGKRFTVDIARAKAEASAGQDPAMNGYEVSVVAFGQSIYDISETGGEISREEDFSVAKKFAVGGLGFGFGPVRIGLLIDVGGELGININDSLSTTTNAQTCSDNLEGGAYVLCGQIGRTTTPFFAFTTDILGGVKIGPVSGGVEANLRLINTEFPLAATLNFGVDDTGKVSVNANATWDLELRLIVGDVSIVGRIRFRRRFLRRFNRTLRVHLFSFSSPLISLNLLDETIPVEVLQ